VVAGGHALLLPQALDKVLGAAAQAHELIGQHVAAGAVRAKFGLVLGQDVALVPCVPEPVPHLELLAIDVNQKLAHERSAPGLLADVAGADRVAIGVPGNAVVVADLAWLCESGIEAPFGQRQQLGPLLFEPRRGLLVRGAVLSLGFFISPLSGLAIEVLEVAEMPARQEIVFHEAEGLLDLAFPLFVTRSQGDGGIAVMGDHRLEDRMEDHPLPEALEHHLLHPVVEDLPRYSTGFLESHYVAVGDAARVGVQQEVDELPAAEAEDHREADDLGGGQPQDDGVG